MSDSMTAAAARSAPPLVGPARPDAPTAEAPPTARETAWFIAVTLVVSWTLGALWIRGIGGYQIVQWMMCVPAIVGFACAWAFRREPPRAAGFAFTGWGPWLVAFFYPLAMVLAAIGLGYAVRAVTGNPDFIRYQPEVAPTRGLFGAELHVGLAAVGIRACRIALRTLPWLGVALAYRFGLPDRVRDALPAGLRPLHHAFRALLFAPVIWFYPGPLAPPGAIGEELGWRGHLVRRWASRPVMAAALTMPVWAAFHLPVILMPTQRGHLAQNVFFLASIALAAVVFAALYLWSRSIWPCALAHFAWNFWNPALLGDVYGGAPGMFGGQVWIFNGEGVFGFVINGVLALALWWRWRRRAAAPAPASR